MKKARKRISISEIARACKVGTTTVSRVINNHKEVADETRERVQRMIRGLGYIPSPSARNMALRGNKQDIGQTRTIAVIDPLERNTTVAHAEIITALIREAAGMGYRTVVTGPGGDNLNYEPFDGLLLLNDMRVDVKKNHVTVDWFSDNSAIPGVLPDYRTGAFRAICSALELGYHNPRLLSSKDENLPGNFTSLLYRGFTEALYKHDLSPEGRVSQFPVFTKEEAYTVTGKLLALPDAPDLLLCSDDAAMGVYRAAREAGRDIGRDLGIIGCDGISLTEYMQPSLATISINIKQLAQEAVSRLVAVINQEPGPYPQQYLMPVEFVSGDSLR